ncbi:MAG: 50S ribosomal protein L18Ae [Candidatus Hadarchaeales archaeon]
MKIYQIKGRFRQGIDKATFTKIVPALSEIQALERVYSDLGSRHKLKRSQIDIDEVKEIKPEEITDKRMLEMVGK